MTIENLTLSYPDFQAGAVINPEEFDQNNNEIVTKVNEVIDVVNMSSADALTIHKTSADHDGRYYTETEVDAALALKAPLVSPALTGIPTAPTATPDTNTTQIATTAFVTGSMTAHNVDTKHKQAASIVQTGLYANAEGDTTTASGDGSHAEGYCTVASGNYSHAEGCEAVAVGSYSHAEGYGTVSRGNYSHAEGKSVLAANGTLYTITTFDNTAKTITLDTVTGLGVGTKLQIHVTSGTAQIDVPITNVDIENSKVTLDTSATITTKWNYAVKLLETQYPGHAEGCDTVVSGNYSHAEGNQCVAGSTCSHAEGYRAKATGPYSHAEGDTTTASAEKSHAEGNHTLASNSYTHAEGSYTVASGSASHAQGSFSTASGEVSHAEGAHTTASGVYSHSGGNYTNANVFASHAIGQYNKALTGSASAYSGTADALVIGNGTGAGVLGNAFRVTFDGKVYGLSAFNSSGADYAEYFEWLDGNLNAEDRVGYFVTLDGDKIRKANSTDDYILGVVSAQPSVVGDSYQDDWKDKYVTNEWGRIQYQEVEVPDKVSRDGDVIVPAHTDLVPVINPEWNPDLPYIPREQRSEWSAVGMMGKLLIRDDGTCVVDGYCKSNDDGIGTASLVGYRVMKRVADNIILILVK